MSGNDAKKYRDAVMKHYREQYPLDSVVDFDGDDELYRSILGDDYIKEQVERQKIWDAFYGTPLRRTVDYAIS